MKQPKHITLNGFNYTEDSKCPACSGEQDTGGRLVFRKRTNWFLKCKKCKYSVQSERAIHRQALYFKKKQDAQLGIKSKWKSRPKKKLKITKEDRETIRKFLELKKKTKHN